MLPEPLAPPLAWSFLESVELDAEPDIEPEGAVLGEEGEVVEPDDEVEPEGDLVAPREAAPSPLRSQAVTRAVPRATETASAIVVNLM